MSEDVEKKFVSFFAKLRENVNPDDIAAQLLAKHVISQSEKADIDLLPCTLPKRMDKLLEAVHRAINIDPTNYKTFLDILGIELKYSALVQEMRGKVVFHIY